MRRYLFVLLIPVTALGLGAETVSAVGFLEAGVDSCAKPLTVPDRFADTDGSGAWTSGVDYYDPFLTGYKAPDDVGIQFVLHAGLPPGVVPGAYFLVDFPPTNRGTPLVGETWFREWMSGCSPYQVFTGDWLQVEPGNLLSTLFAEVDSLIARDSLAVWDEGSQSVTGSAFEVSPREVALPFYDPAYGIQSGRNEVLVRKIVFFFIESRGPGTIITGRFLDVIESDGTPVHPATWGRLKTLYGSGGSQ